MSIIVGLIVVLGLVGFLVYALSKSTERAPDPDDQPDVSPPDDVLGGPGPRAPGGHTVPGVGPDGRP